MVVCFHFVNNHHYSAINGVNPIQICLWKANVDYYITELQLFWYRILAKKPSLKPQSAEWEVKGLSKPATRCQDCSLYQPIKIYLQLTAVYTGTSHLHSYSLTICPSHLNLSMRHTENNREDKYLHGAWPIVGSGGGRVRVERHFQLGFWARERKSSIRASGL